MVENEQRMNPSYIKADQVHQFHHWQQIHRDIEQTPTGS